MIHPRRTAVAVAALAAACGGGVADEPTRTATEPDRSAVSTPDAPTSTTAPATTVTPTTPVTVTTATAGSTGVTDATTTGSPVVAAPTDRPSRVTPADDGRTFRLAVGDVVDLIVPDPFAPDPTVDGTAIELIEVVNVQASGERRWELTALSAGRVVVSAVGERPYSMEFVVSG